MPLYTLNYSESLVRAAARSYVFGQFDWKLVVAGVAVGAVVAYGLLSGDRSMTFGFVLAAFAIMASVLVYAFFAFQARASKLLRELNGESVALDVSDTRLKFSAPSGSFEIPIGRVAALRRYEEYAILVYSGGGYSTLPIASLGQDGIARISQLVLQAGGKVA